MKVLLPEKKKQILLVEDNLADIVFTQKALQKTAINANLYAVRDGEEALEFLYRRGKYYGAPRPDLILLDINLPKMSGHEVLQKLRSETHLENIPIVILTSSDAEFDISKSKQMSVRSYWIKPCNFGEFCRMIKQIETIW
ncbi:MAG: response regulator [Cytophagales bacterium]|nr:response regulator [Cytophagales bacterium]MDW8384326.1 response regulator [Flammeovirgaceae bacterium]